MAIVNIPECEKAGIDQKVVQRIASRIERAAKDARKLGITVFGGTGSGSLRASDGSRRPLILCDLGGSWDGGDGSYREADDGFLRGE